MIKPRPLSSVRSRIAASLGLVVFLVLVGTGTAQAFWTSVSSALSATATSTNAQVTLSDMSSLNTVYNYTGATSPTIIQAVTLKNTGGAPLTFALTDTTNNATLAAKIKVSFWLQSGSCGTVVPPASTTGTLAALPALPTGAASASAGVSDTICVATQLQGTAAASAGTSVTASFTLTGKVGNWQDTDAATATQSVFQAADVTITDCQNSGFLLGETATVSWTLPAGATGASVYAGSSLVSTVTSPNHTFTASTGNVGGSTSITIRANYAGGVQSAGVTQALRPIQLIFNFGISCG